MSIMKIAILTASLLFANLISFSRDYYLVKFNGRQNSPYSLEDPQAFLSDKAIQRRIALNIPLDEKDLPVNPDYINGIKNIDGVEVLRSSKWFNAVTIQTDNTNALNAISQLDFVKGIERISGNAMRTVPDKFIVPAENPASYNGLRTASFNYGNAFNQTQMININELHDIGFTGQNMLIAVIDGGFLDAPMMDCFDSLFLQNRVVSTWDFVDNESDVYDDNWHGTAVLSTMAANIAGDMVGTAPHAQYILLRSEDTGSEFIIEEYNWASAAEYADSAGADIINSSLGYTEFDDPSQNHTYSDLDGNTTPVTIAADIAASKGILVVNSAGNSGNTAWQYIGAPADGDSVLAIGAVDGTEVYASFSSTGPSFDGRIKPDVAAQGAGTTVYFPGFGSSVPSNGTSFSSPVIAGASACLRQVYPQKDNVEIMQAIKMSASHFNTPDNLTGYGIPDFGIASLVLGGYEPSLFNNGLALIDFFPNPVKRNETFTLRYFSKNEKAVTVTITDASGKSVYSRQITAEDSIVPIDINTSYQAGLYFISFFSDSEKVIKKLVIL